MVGDMILRDVLSNILWKPDRVFNCVSTTIWC